MFGDRPGVGAAVGGDGNCALLRGGQIDLVVAGGEQLDEFEVLGLADGFACQGGGVEDQVIGVGEGGEDGFGGLP